MEMRDLWGCSTCKVIKTRKCKGYSAAFFLCHLVNNQNSWLQTAIKDQNTRSWHFIMKAQSKSMPKNSFISLPPSKLMRVVLPHFFFGTEMRQPRRGNSRKECEMKSAILIVGPRVINYQHSFCHRYSVLLRTMLHVAGL